MNNSDETKIAESLKEYYIAYVDMLGYKAFFKEHSDEVPNLLGLIKDAINKTKNYVSEANNSELINKIGNIDVKVKAFSDNILFCLETGNSSNEIVRLLTFLAIVADVQKSFAINYGLFLRGGVTKGSLYFDSDFVFGQGLIDAVEMEGQAIYPRIIVSDAINEFVFKHHYISAEVLSECAKTIEEINSNQQVSEEKLQYLNQAAPYISQEHYSSQIKYKLIFTDADGKYILDYLYNVNPTELLPPEQLQSIIELIKMCFPNDLAHFIFNNETFPETLKIHRDAIIKKLQEYGQYANIPTSAVKVAEEREKVLKKYMWSMAFHNYSCQINKLEEYMIFAQANCDRRFLKMNVDVPIQNNTDD